jgi:hypothetical protein
MADTNHPAERCSGARPEIVRHDGGGWISGPSVGSRTETVAAEHVRSGDTLVLDDGSVATVTDIGRGDYWLAGGHGPGVAIGWRSGSSRGVLFRHRDDLLYRTFR